MRHLIIGAGPAGLAAAAAIRAADPAASITLLSEEQGATYSRPLISYWLGREIREDQLAVPASALPEAELRTGVKVVALVPEARQLRLDTGEVLPYDRLLLATGAVSKPLGLAGEGAENLFGLRTRDDAEGIDREIHRGARRVAVLGGGLVGVKAAQALAARGLETHLCVTSAFPLSRNVDSGAGSLLVGALEDEGVRVHLGQRPAALQTHNGRVTAVVFDPPAGRLDCDLVVRGKGVLPRTELLEGFGFPVGDGVPTDTCLRTPLPDVWAAGDVALTRDVISGEPSLHAIWPAAVEQGTLAGRNMAGAELEYPGALAMNAVGVGGLFVVAAGLTRPDNGSCRARIDRHPNLVQYRAVVDRDGALVGVVAVGHPDQAGILVAAVRAGALSGELPFDSLDRRLHWGRFALAGQR